MEIVKKKCEEKIKKSIEKNNSKKIIFKDNYNYLKAENNFLYYEDEKGNIYVDKLAVNTLKTKRDYNLYIHYHQVLNYQL